MFKCLEVGQKFATELVFDAIGTEFPEESIGVGPEARFGSSDVTI